MRLNMFRLTFAVFSFTVSANVAGAATLFYQLDITPANNPSLIDVILGIDAVTHTLESAVGTVGTQPIIGLDSAVTNQYLNAGDFNAVDPGTPGFVRAAFEYGQTTQELVLSPAYGDQYVSVCENGNCSTNPLDAYNATVTLAQVAPAAVPEPTSWALLLLGFSLMGSMIRSRKRAGVKQAPVLPNMLQA